MPESIEVFKNHKAIRTIEGTIEKITWGNKDGSCFYFIKYLIDGNRLIISGDCGIAVFEFTECMTAEKIAKGNFEYIMRKHVCSEYDKYELNQEKFQKDIDNWVEQYKGEYGNTIRRVKENKKEIMETFNNSNSVKSYVDEIAFKIDNGDITIEDDEIYEDDDNYFGYSIRNYNVQSNLILKNTEKYVPEYLNVELESDDFNTDLNSAILKSGIKITYL